MKCKLPSLFIVLALLALIQPVLAQPDTLSIVRSNNQVVLSWPATGSNYVLQYATNLSSLLWSTSSPAPVVVNGRNLVTNSILGKPQFYKLALAATPPGMALIPAGSFTMGDTLDGESDAIPISVTASAFYMDTNLASYSQWQSVYNWATNHGYGFDDAGSGKAANNPVQTVDWYDVVKWSNARSEMAGLTPCYYTDATQKTVYRTGENDLQVSFVNWGANGYRLPTEAEWEKAARGGLSGQRFPWGNTISESQANYLGYPASSGGYTYDLGPYGYNAIGNYPATTPGTSPVASFAANGYGLYDMAGNVLEWCWDWYGTPYAGGTDPRGPASSPVGARVLRGGNWYSYAVYARCAYRGDSAPDFGGSDFGFRCVRGF